MTRQLAAVPLEWVSEAPLRLVYHQEIAAPPARVYDALADDPATWTWFPTLTGGRFPTDERGVGAPRHVTVQGAKFTETVMAADPGRRWAYRVDTSTAPLARALIEDWVLTEVPATSTRPAATRIAYTFALDPLPRTRRLVGATGAGIALVFARAARNLERRLSASA